MNRFLIGLGLLLVGLSIYYGTYRSTHEEVPDLLTYGLGITACLFISFFIYRLMQYIKKK
jgi:hypothetical protein